MKWVEIQREIVRYQSRAWLPCVVFMSTGVAFALMLHGGVHAALAFLLFLAGGLTAICLAVTQGIECPNCRKKIQYGAYGNSSQLDILKNLHQCPHCQCRFD